MILLWQPARVSLAKTDSFPTCSPRHTPHSQHTHVIHVYRFIYIKMVNCGESSKGEDYRRAEVTTEQQYPPTERNPSLGDSLDIATYMPNAPSSESSAIATSFDSLSMEQRDMISYFVQATQKTVGVAIQTLQQTEWDLVDAVAQFDDGCDEQEHKETADPSTPVIESIP